MSYRDDLAAIGAAADLEVAELRDQAAAEVLRADLAEAEVTRQGLEIDALTAEVEGLRTQLADCQGAEPPEEPAVPTMVTIGTVRRRIDGIDVPRGENQLVLYRSTPDTNRWGVEVVVTVGTVTAVYNRLAVDTGPTLVPDGGYVLSGHGGGAGLAGQWLHDHARVGDPVTLHYDAVPDPTPSGEGRIVSMWHHGWAGPLPWVGYPEDVRRNLTMIILAIAQSGGRGTGRMVYHDRFGGTALRDAITAATQAGVPVLMGIGGASDGGITITTTTQAQEAAAALSGWVDRYGITGVDIDLEPSGSAWTEPALVEMVDLLQQRHPGFLVGITPGLYGPHTARWLSLARTLGDRYTYMAPMLYDFPEAGDSRLTGVALDKCRIMIDGGVPEGKIVLGFMTRRGHYPNSTPGPQLTIDAWRACLARYPGIRGAFHWEDSIDQANGWAWARQAGPVIRGDA